MNLHKSYGDLGFRDLHDFNMALLCKQSWCLLSQPNTLVSKLFEAKYFPHSFFLDAKLGNNPSFIWRGLVATQELIRVGARRCIGNGLSTNILGTPGYLVLLTPMLLLFTPVYVTVR